MVKQFSVAVCGSARVGKSTLINAIFGKRVAETSSSLRSQTDKMEQYVLRRNGPSENDASSSTEYSITVWDTPGIESWKLEDVQKHFTKIMNESTPLCMIYCASPGSFAKLEQLQWVLDTCVKSNIFCAFVCTNKFCGGSQQRGALLNDFHSLLSRHHPMTRDEANIRYYGNIGLCTSVNSIVYEDRDLGVRKDVEGVNELIFAITASLRHDKVVAWCYAIADNQSFWSMMRDNIIKLFNLCLPVVEELLQGRGKDIAKALIPMIMRSIAK